MIVTTAGEQLRHALADHLTQGIGIVGVIAHHIAVGVGIKIRDGQGLHMVEHLVTDALQGTLRHHRHQTVVEQGAEYARDIHKGHAGNGLGQAGKDRVAFQQKREM